MWSCCNVDREYICRAVSWVSDKQTVGSKPKRLNERLLGYSFIISLIMQEFWLILSHNLWEDRCMDDITMVVFYHIKSRFYVAL